VKGTDVGKRRVRRLVVAGLLWTFVLVFVAPGLARLVLGQASRDSVFADPSDIESGIDPRLGRVASGLSGSDADVWCWSSEDWKERVAEWERRDPLDRRLGPRSAYTEMDASTIHLSPEICAELRSLVEHDLAITGDAPGDPRAWSLGAFAHEAFHAMGYRDEAQATCFGMQEMEGAAVMLGMTPAQGSHLATLFWKHWYDRLPPSYRSDECREGGGLDLDLKTDVWP
jgi:hypothetical protein